MPGIPEKGNGFTVQGGLPNTHHGDTALFEKEKDTQARKERAYALRNANANRKLLSKKAADRKAGVNVSKKTQVDRTPYRQAESKAAYIANNLDHGVVHPSAKPRLKIELQNLLTEESRDRAKGAILPPPHPKSFGEKAKHSLKAKRDNWRSGKVSGSGPDITNMLRENTKFKVIRAIKPGDLPDID